MKTLSVPATFMRGGTSKGVFFNLEDLPEKAQEPGPWRDLFLQRVIGSPDPYQKQIDGMGGATSSTSKVVIISPSKEPNHDIDYLFGQVSIDEGFIDWSGNCGNLSSAVGPFAIANGLIEERNLDAEFSVVKIWQKNIKKTIIAKVPVERGQVKEIGEFELDGVTFPAAEIELRFKEPVDSENEQLFPTGNLSDEFDIPDFGLTTVTMINAGIPTIFLPAEALHYKGTELQEDINSKPAELEKLEHIRARASVAMGITSEIGESKKLQHIPKLAFLSAPQDYVSSSGKAIKAKDVNLLVRAMSMGKLHHAMMGTAAVAIGAAAAIPGTVVNKFTSIDSQEKSIVFGHPSGTLRVGADAAQTSGKWVIQEVSMSRSARVLMQGSVRVHMND